MSQASFMARCIELALQAQGRTAPNPMVGALVVRENEIVGEGWHRLAGAEHAEVLALRQAGARARGADLYVSLEPCCHHGRTPPCTEAILSAGIRRVFVGIVDPNPLVNGKGLALLREAGVEVEVGLLQHECEDLNAAFFTAQRLGRPRIVLKAASTLDGCIATAQGESQWITGPEARTHGHRLRDLHDAILVGSGTALADNPTLTCRIPGGRDPLPVLLDSRLRIPPQAHVFGGSRKALVFHAEHTPQTEHPAQLLAVPPGPGGLDLGSIMSHLLRAGVHSLLVEGGAHVHRSFLDAGLVDQLLLFLAPRVLGGGLPWVAGPGLTRLEQAWDFELSDMLRLGGDLLLTLDRRR